MPELDPDLLRIKNKKRIAKAGLTRLENFFQNVDRGAMDIDEVKLKINRLDETWKTLLDIQVELAVIDREASEEQLDKELVEYENRYTAIKLIAERLVKVRVRPVTYNDNLDQAVGNAQGHESSYHSHVRLPKIDLPTFSGSYEDWYPFYDVSNSLIHSNNNLNDIQRFHYLKSSLKSEAAEIIESLEISGANYTDAWSRLKERYDNERLAVQNHIKAIFDLPVAKKENYVAIRRVSDGVLKHTRALQALKRPTQQWDDLLIHIVTSKLDITTIKEWEANLKPTQIPSFQELTEFLSRRCQTLEAVAKRSLQQQESVSIRQPSRGKVTASHAITGDVKCTYCKGHHLIYQCKSFQSLTVSERANQAKWKGLCLNCLRSKHLAKDCLSGGCKSCGKKHNTLLHVELASLKDDKDKRIDQNQKQASDKDEKGSNSVNCNHTQIEKIRDSNHVLLSTAVVKVRDYKNIWVPGRALLDSGSQSNFITEEFAHRLGFRLERSKINVKGINQQVYHAFKAVNLSITSRFDSFGMNLRCIVLPKITQNLPLIEYERSDFNIPNNIRLADPQFYKSGKIDLLIGAEMFWDLVCIGQIRIGKNRPVLQKSLLGWILSGRMISPENQKSQTICNLSLLEELNDTVNKFWQVENCLDDKGIVAEEEYSEQFFKETHSRDADGRFVVRLPVKENALKQLGNSKDSALKRFYALERKFDRMPELKTEYVEFMNEYLALGHMRRVAESDPDKLRVFLPHQAVINENSTTTKTRVVFDASSKDSKGVSLNDTLYKGPTIQADLFSIVMRFRCFKYVLTADIKKMYRQIWVHEEHRPLQTIFWRENANDPIQVFELVTLTYGTKPASFLAVKCLQQLAEDEEGNYPIAGKIVCNDFYMDDLLTGSNAIESIMQLKEELTKLLLRGGFELHKWSTNIQNFDKDKSCFEDRSVNLDSDPESKLLGILWNTCKDTLNYTAPIEKRAARVTKRAILSEVARLFDPLGLVGLVITSGKILIQELWMLKIGWDDAVPMSVQKSWFQIKSQLSLLESIEIPRLIVSGNSESRICLHGFSDASEQAYGACIYILEEESGRVLSVKLLCSKSRVAPLKMLSLPRLELCGAVLLIKLMKKVLTSLNVKVYEKCFWTDSKIVLAWISSPARRWQTFVANRVSEIQSSSLASEWRYVRSKDNPADLISRGITPALLKSSAIWWEGPNWLKSNKDNWPTEIKELQCQNIPEKRKEVIVAIACAQEQVIRYEEYSSLDRLLRISAYLCVAVYS